DTVININENTFNHTFNSIHLRGAATKWTANVENNIFQDSLGYILFDQVKKATYVDNIYLDRLGVDVDVDRIIDNTASTFRVLSIAAPIFEDFEIVGEDLVEV